MLLLIVKGSRETAEAAAEARLIPFIFKAESQTEKAYLLFETWLEVPSDQRSKVMDWFAEPATMSSIPLRYAGTLLFFTERNDR